MRGNKRSAASWTPTVLATTSQARLYHAAKAKIGGATGRPFGELPAWTAVASAEEFNTGGSDRLRLMNPPITHLDQAVAAGRHRAVMRRHHQCQAFGGS